jgi:hypothetical protein
MAEHMPMPDVWVDKEVNVTCIAAGKTNDVNCTIREVNDRGVGVKAQKPRSSPGPAS